MSMQYCFIFLFFVTHILDFTKSTTPFQDNISNVNEETRENSRQVVLDKVFRDATPCECLENGCSCSFNFFADNPSNLNPGRLSMKYDSDNGLALSLRIGETENHVVIKDIISGVDLPPLCARVPRLPVLKLCAVFYDVRLNQGLGLHLCSSIESQALVTTISSISFDCVNLSSNKINTIPPDQQRPSFVNLHVGKSPKITFFNSVSVGVIPIGIPPLIENDSVDTLDINPM